MTSMPALARLGMTMGTSATRLSPGYVSRGTPTIMNLPPSGPSARHTRSIRNPRQTVQPAQAKVENFLREGHARNEWLQCSGRRGSQASGAGHNRDATTHSVSCRNAHQTMDFTCKLAKVQSKIEDRE